MRSNQSGFTLIESIIVLSIFLLMASLSVFLLKPHYLFFEKERFISIFKADILFSQQYAIAQQKRLIVYIPSNDQHFYVKEKGSDQFIIDREIPASIKIEQGSLGNRSINFEILPDGGTSNFGTLFFTVGKERYKVTFQIGAGRFYVVKE